MYDWQMSKGKNKRGKGKGKPFPFPPAPYPQSRVVSYEKRKIHNIMPAKLPIIIEHHPQPLPACGEGRQSTALAGWGSSKLFNKLNNLLIILDIPFLVIQVCGFLKISNCSLRVSQILINICSQDVS